MLRSTKSISSFADFLPRTGEFFLSEVRLDIRDPSAVMFAAKLHGPVGAPVWARAWVSNQADGTLAEAASDQMTAGDKVALTIRLECEEIPDHAYMRIESAPLNTEHVVGTELI